MDTKNSSSSPDVSKFFDDDGRLKRTGTVWTTSAHIITTVIGSGVLCLPWAIAQLGWIAGPVAMLSFAAITYYTSILLSVCYRTSDGRRNYTYMDAVRANLGGFQVKLCGAIQYLTLSCAAIGYTIGASVSMVAIQKSNCFHSTHHNAPCKFSSNMYMIIFGALQILFSQIPDFDQIWWLSTVAAVMSFTYSTIGLGLGVARVAQSGTIRGSLTGVKVGTMSLNDKIWRIFQSLGAIAFAYTYSPVLIEIEDTIKSPPSEHKTMKKANLLSVTVTTLFYMLCGCFGYASFGDSSPGNILTGFGFYNPYWLLDIANVAIVVHLVGAYQVLTQPVFAFVEKTVSGRFPESKLISKEIEVPLYGFNATYKLNLFRLVWRTIFVIFTTVVAMLIPFFNDIVGIIGAFAFWPLTVYFPIQMYIALKKIPKWERKWICLQALSAVCLIVSIIAAVGSVAGVADDLKVYKPFKTTS